MSGVRISIAVVTCSILAAILALVAWNIGVTNASAIVGIVTGTIVGGLVVTVSRKRNV